MYLHLCYPLINTDTLLGLDILCFFLPLLPKSTLSVRSLLFPLQTVRSFPCLWGLILFPIKSARDLTRGVGQGHGLGWELQKKLCSAEGLETEHWLTALWSQSGATGLKEQSQYLQLRSRPDADLNSFRSQSDTRKKYFIVFPLNTLSATLKHLE